MERERGRTLSGFPTCQLFEAHGSKFKPHPVGYLGQTAVKSVAHGVFFFSVGKNPFNGFLVPGIEFLVLRGVPGIVSQFLIVLLDVPQDGLYAVFGFGT